MVCRPARSTSSSKDNRHSHNPGPKTGGQISSFYVGAEAAGAECHDMSLNVMTLRRAAGSRSSPAGKAATSTEPRSGSRRRPGEPSLRRQDAQMLFHRVRARSDDPGLRPERHFGGSASRGEARDIEVLLAVMPSPRRCLEADPCWTGLPRRDALSGGMVGVDYPPVMRIRSSS